MRPLRSLVIGVAILGSFAVCAIAAAPEPPRLRLPDTVHPTRYALHLTLRPDSESFSGEVEIALDLREPTSFFWLHGDRLEVEEAVLVTDSGRIAAKPTAGAGEFLGFALERAAGPGAARFVVRYRGQVGTDEVGGLIRRRLRDDWYLFSQLEATYARRVFPCFDEPGFKVPMQLSVTARLGQVVFSNTPVASETEAADGTKTVRFETTRPLPTYLLAVAVGPFEVVDAGTAGRNETPIRIITPRGETAKAAWAAEATGPILELLEDYFDLPYPFPKLDQIALPNFLGAMENPGLVTYDHGLLLRDPGQDTVRRQRGFAETCAHELAHMWFGDLVTLAWWDDTWLNESFATWMESKTIGRWKPEWRSEVSEVRQRGRAMDADSLTTARRVRQPIASHHDIRNAFDGITFNKGGAVLTMFESWLGEETFREGVRRYIRNHADGNATGDDFLAALGEVGGPDVTGAFASFLDQSGVPLVRVELSATADGKPGLSLSQRRYLPRGSTAPSAQRWTIPVCVEYGNGKSTGRRCTLMTGPTARIELETDRVPGWVLPNSGMVGYYRVDYPGDLFDRLFERRMLLTLPERIGLIDDMEALVAAGQFDYGDALARVPQLLKERDRHIIAATMGIASGVEEHLVPPELRPSYAHFVRKMYGKNARSLGWTVHPDDDDDTRLMRPRLLWLVAADGEDPPLAAEAATLARRWLEDRAAVHPDLVETVLAVAARNGDASLWKRFHDRARIEQDLEDRKRLLGAMGNFRDAALVERNLQLVLGDEFDFLESIRLLFGALAEPATRELAYAWVKENFDPLL